MRRDLTSGVLDGMQVKFGLVLALDLVWALSS